MQARQGHLIIFSARVISIPPMRQPPIQQLRGIITAEERCQPKDISSSLEIRLNSLQKLRHFEATSRFPEGLSEKCSYSVSWAYGSELQMHSSSLVRKISPILTLRYYHLTQIPLWTPTRRSQPPIYPKVNSYATAPHFSLASRPRAASLP